MKVIFITIVLLSFAIIACANPYLVCDPQDGVSEYKIVYGIGLTAPDPNMEITVVPDSTGTYGFTLDLEGIPNGTYMSWSRACNLWGCSEWSSFGFVVDRCGVPQNIIIRKIK